jgi:hypothetical protein
MSQNCYNPVNTAIDVSFTIPTDIATGVHDLTVTTFYDSDHTPFYIGDPTPEIDSVGEPWQAGVNPWYFTVRGSWFGLNPSITISGGGVGTYGILGSSETSISAWVDLTASQGGEASVTVESHGLTGTYFAPAPGQGSTSQSSKTAEIRACAVPLNFRQEDPGWVEKPGMLWFNYQWDSSTGRAGDLAACNIKETIEFNPKPVPSPPFPMTYLKVGEAFPASWLAGTDHWGIDAAPSDFVKPYSWRAVTYFQEFKYQCQCHNNNAWTSLSPVIQGIDSVMETDPGSGVWIFRSQKPNITPANLQAPSSVTTMSLP